MNRCTICLKPSKDEHHRACLQALFGTSACPTVDTGEGTIDETIAQQSERISISGVQKKLLVDLSLDGRWLRPNNHGRFILKPQVSGYSHLPENEHLTMLLAREAGLEVPPVGLVSVGPKTRAYVVRRFDRTTDEPPRKRRQEDFCSLSGRDPSDKYQSSAEECATLVRRYVENPTKSLRQLFRLFAFSHWVSNGDLHLKNVSLLEQPPGGFELSPAYDLLSTRLYPQLKQSREAMPLNGKTEQLDAADFEQFGRACGLSVTDAAEDLKRMAGKSQVATELIQASFLPPDLKREYARWLRQRGRRLAPRRLRP